MEWRSGGRSGGVGCDVIAQALPPVPVRPAGRWVSWKATTVLEQFGPLGLAESKLLKAVHAGPGLSSVIGRSKLQRVTRAGPWARMALVVQPRLLTAGKVHRHSGRTRGQGSDGLLLGPRAGCSCQTTAAAEGGVRRDARCAAVSWPGRLLRARCRQGRSPDEGGCQFGAVCSIGVAGAQGADQAANVQWIACPSKQGAEKVDAFRPGGGGPMRACAAHPGPSPYGASLRRRVAWSEERAREVVVMGTQIDAKAG